MARIVTTNDAMLAVPCREMSPEQSIQQLALRVFSTRNLDKIILENGGWYSSGHQDLLSLFRVVVVSSQETIVHSDRTPLERCRQRNEERCLGPLLEYRQLTLPVNAQNNLSLGSYAQLLAS